MELRAPDDLHLHVRSGRALATTVPMAVRQCARALIMPNLKPPITTTAAARAYRDEIIKACGDQADQFTPLMSLYLTDQTSIGEIEKAAASGIIVACKLYPAGATTNSSSGVTDITRMYPVFEAMARHDLLLLIHSEVTDPDIDIFDRERVFIERHVQGLVAALPALKIVLEHVTTAFAVDFVRACGDHVAATITPQHLLENRNALFKGGLRPHWYCLPILKTEADRIALVNAATSGSGKFFMGSDSAPHAKEAKESSCGCAGCFVGVAALELYAEAFDQVGKMDQLEAFTSEFGALFYGLPLNTRRVTLERRAWQIPLEVPFEASVAVPFRAGEQLSYSIAQ